MTIANVTPPGDLQSVAELRELYRSAESRLARLRLVIEAGHDLAVSSSDNLPAVLANWARRTALFLGAMDGEVIFEPSSEGVALFAPGGETRQVGTLVIRPHRDAPLSFDGEDKAALAMLSQLLGAAIDRVGRDLERENLLSLLQEREKRLEYVVNRLFSAQEEERRRVSRDLHDGVAQTASALFRSLESRTGSKDADVSDLALVAQNLVRELRCVIAGLRPTVLDDLGLAAAVVTLAEGLRADGFDVDCRTDGIQRWPNALETAFFRVAQESVNNIRRHSGGPCHVDIFLIEEEGTRTLCIRDRGVGFDVAGFSRAGVGGQHIGLDVMRERMSSIGGEFLVKSAIGQGVEIVARSAASR
jgi:two-component system NarL family sensor kinase